MRVAILGSGNIGTDLLFKVIRSPFLSCALFVGRRTESPGLRVASGLGIATSDQGIQAIIDDPGAVDVVFDATTAHDHRRHAPILAGLGKMVIDMTPSRVGRVAVPAVDLESSLEGANINMVSCGGQASIPLARLISDTHGVVDYIEVVSSIASKSAGPATRINIDEYIETTEAAIVAYTGCARAKVILILNPAEPCIDMQTTVSAQMQAPNVDAVREALPEVLDRVRSYVPGYELVTPPVFETNRIVIMVRVKGRGDFLPTYAGNLDIINCAAVAAAEQYAQRAVPVLADGMTGAIT
jgi:acetaldehyde dehydrogenase (acetylating)